MSNMSGRSVKVRVYWDDDDDRDDTGLPDIVEVPDHVIKLEEEYEGAIADWLAVQYEFCVYEVAILDDEDEVEAIREGETNE